MKHIVILGGGFAGVAAGLKLSRSLDHQATVTLIDKNPYHLFTSSLYEVATSEEPQKNITIPLGTIFRRRVTVMRGTVEEIHPHSQTIALRNTGTVSYDYLIIALGSIPAFFSIPGLKEHALTLKNLTDAVKIKEKIKSLCCKEGICHRKVQLVIGGGGFAGTELAEELLTYKDKIAKENGLDKDCLEVTIIQGSHRLLKELDSHASSLARKRMAGYNVKLAFGSRITNVDDKHVYTEDGTAYPYEIFIWAGGVEANHLPAQSGLPVNHRGQLLVNNSLQVEGYENIFAAGDVAGYADPKTKEPVPNVAQVAEDQGRTAAENVQRLLEGKSLTPYKYAHWGYVVPLRGRFAVAELMFGLHFDGFLGWVLQQLIFLRYLLGILPLSDALKRWNKFELELDQ